VARNRADPECREQLASLRMDAGDPREAARQLETLRAAGAVSKGVLDALGYAYLRMGEYGRALALFESSLARFGPDATLHANLGYCHRALGNLAAAVEHYSRARDLAPRDPDRAHDLAFALYLARDYARAVEPFQAALKLRPGWGLAHYNLALACWNLRQYGPALAHARAAVELGVRDAEPVVRALSSQLALGVPPRPSRR